LSVVFYVDTLLSVFERVPHYARTITTRQFGIRLTTLAHWRRQMVKTSKSTWRHQTCQSNKRQVPSVTVVVHNWCPTALPRSPH